MRALASVSLTFAILMLAGIAPVPRKSPELTFLDSAGNRTSISSFKGRVVLVEFLLMECPHCLRVTQMVNKLHEELGARGFEAVGVAFDNGANGPSVAYFARFFKLSFPIGYTSSGSVDGYLGRSLMEQIEVPQIVVIDRQGVIRAQSLRTGEKNLEDEIYLRSLIDALLK